MSYDDSQIEIGDSEKNYTPEIYLCKHNKEPIGSLHAQDFSSDDKANEFNTVTFNIKRELYNTISDEGQIDPVYELVEDLQLIYVIGYGYYQIEVDIKADGITETKTVTGKSWESELNSKYLESFQVNTFEEYDETDSKDNFVKTVFFNENDTAHSLMHRVLKNTGWSVKLYNSQSTDYQALCAKQRTFDTDRQDIYSFLSDLEDDLDIKFEYGKTERLITIYLLSDYGEDSGIYASFENLNKELDIKSSMDSIVTSLTIKGGDGIDIDTVLPNSSSKIYNFDYYASTKFMSQDTIDAYNYYKERYAAITANYSTILLQYEAELKKELSYKNSAPMVSTSDTDGTIVELNAMTEEQLTAAFQWKTYDSTVEEAKQYNYGKVYLNSIYEAYKGAKEARIEAGNTSDSKYAQIILVMNCADRQLVLLNALISTCETNEANYKSQLTTIKATASLYALFQEYFKKSNLSVVEQDKKVQECYEELLSFERNDEYSNDNYFTTELDTSVDEVNITKELIAKAEIELEKNCKPHPTWTATLLKIKSIDCFKDKIDKLKVGNYLWLELHEGYAVKIRIIGIEDPHNTADDITFTFADKLEEDNKTETLSEKLGKAASVAASIDFYASQMDKFSDSYKYYRSLIDYGLNAALTQIFNNPNQEISIDSFGILGRKKLDAGDYSSEQLRISNNQLLFTDDNWKTVRTALGKITVKNLDGTTTTKYGLIADTVMVDDLYSIAATIGGIAISNTGIKSPNFTVDANGKVTNGFFIGKNGEILTKVMQITSDSFLLDAGGLSIKSGNTEKNFSDYVGDTANTAIADKIPYTMSITASNGTTFRMGRVNTTLAVVLFRGTDNVTDNYENSHFVWTRSSLDNYGDIYWNSNHSTPSKTLTITKEDVNKNASFTCSFSIDDAVVATASTN